MALPPRTATTTARKSTARKAARSSSSDSTALWRQVRALEHAREALALESEEHKRRLADLRAERDAQAQEHAADRTRLILRTGVITGDLQRALEDKAALAAQLAVAQRTLELQQATNAGVQAAMRAQHAHDRLESRIHRCAVRVALETLGGEKERDTMLRILKHCRRAFTGSDAPPPSRPRSPAPESVVRVEEEETPGAAVVKGEWTPPPRGLPTTLLTPESMPRAQVVDLDDRSSPSTPRREGLRQRRRGVDVNGSPWSADLW